MAVTHTATQRLVDWLLYTLLLLCAAVTLIPFLYLVCSAVKTRAPFSHAFSPPGNGSLGIDWRGCPGTFIITTDLASALDAVMNSVFTPLQCPVTLCAAMALSLAKLRFG
jgi:ABC-type glycerol-3-phosphate transport system permease component